MVDRQLRQIAGGRAVCLMGWCAHHDAADLAIPRGCGTIDGEACQHSSVFLKPMIEQTQLGTRSADAVAVRNSCLFWGCCATRIALAHALSATTTPGLDSFVIVADRSHAVGVDRLACWHG